MVRVSLLPHALLCTCALAPLSQAQVLKRLHSPFPSTDAQNSFGSVMGDVDGDGDTDLILGSTLLLPDGPRRSVLLNDGTGVFAELAGAAAPFVLTQSSAMALGDVDQDGDLDLVEANVGQNRLYLNDGSGHFVDATWQLPAVSDETAAVALLDADSDGDLDALFANADQKSRLVLNLGGGAWEDAAGGVIADPEATFDVAVGDVDADGDTDVLFSAFSFDGSLPPRLALNQGGLFTEAPFALPSPIGDGQIALFDVDQDGDLDVFVGGASGSQVMLNDGAGSFSPGAALAAHPDASTVDWVSDLTFGDVDGDQDVDVLVTYSGTFPLLNDRLFINDGLGGFQFSSSFPADVDSFAAKAHLVDVDGDADLDAVIDERVLALNRGDGTFVRTEELEGEAGTLFQIGSDGIVQDAEFGDADGDGAPDLFVAGRLLLNRDGAFEQAPAGPSAIGSYTTQVGDLDADGDADAVFGAFGDPGVTVWLGDGTGGFVDDTATWLPALGFLKTSEVDLGDVNGDGFPDLWIAVQAAQQAYHLQNGGGVSFIDATGFQDLPYSVAEQVLVDIDMDGDVDLVTASEFQNQLLVNDGIGIFAESFDALPAAIPCRALDVGDWDGDGDPDIVYGTTGLNGELLFQNDGAGLFSDVTGFELNFPADTLGVRLADIDGDEDLDLYLAQAEGDRIYTNDGSGSFIPTELLPEIQGSYEAELADVDGDGDIDAVVAGTGGVLRNTTRQVAWRGAPRIGKPLDMEVYGTPLQPWFLAASTGKASAALSEFGILGLDPAKIFVTIGGALDSSGRALAPFDVPSTPTLVGASVWWQGLVGSPQLAFTNVERTTCRAPTRRLATCREVGAGLSDAPCASESSA